MWAHRPGCYDGAMSILLVPGFMADETLWADMLGPLEPFGPLLHADLRHDSSIEAMARRVLASAPPCFTLVGFSMGAYVAREMARLAPARVRALVLIATSARGDSEAVRRRKGAMSPTAPAAAFVGLSRAAIVSSLHPASSADEALIERVRAMGARLGGEVFRRQSMLVRTGDIGRLHDIACPTLVVAAANDQLRGVDEAEEVRGGIAGATLAVIEDSGHMIPLEAPRRLAALMVDWLTQQNDKASH